MDVVLKNTFYKYPFYLIYKKHSNKFSETFEQKISNLKMTGLKKT